MSQSDVAAARARRAFLKGAGAAGAVALAGCSSDNSKQAGTSSGGGTTSTTGTTTGSGGGGSEKPVTVGWLHPLTGPYAGLAKTQKQGAHLAAKRINANGGVSGSESGSGGGSGKGKQLEVVSEDTQASPQTGKQKARKLVEQDGAVALMGCISSAVASAVADYAKSANVPYYTGGAADSLTMSNCAKTTFRFDARARQNATAGAPWAVKKFGGKLWVHNADYSWGNSVASDWITAAKGAGDVTVVGHTKSKLGTSDFSSYISQIQASDADWVLTGLNGGDAVNFLKQASNYGLKDSKTIVSSANSFQFIRQAAGGAAQDTYSTIRYYEGYDTDANKTFKDAYSNAYGGTPDNFAMVAWSSMNMYADAVKQAGSADTSAVLDKQTKVSYESPVGTASYRTCDHQAARSIGIGKIVAPGPHDWPDLQVIEKVSAKDAILPCSQTGCSL